MLVQEIVSIWDMEPPCTQHILAQYRGSCPQWEVLTDRSIKERVRDMVVALWPFTPEESVHLSQGSSLASQVCACGLEIPPQIASNSKGSILVENVIPILIPQLVARGQCVVHSSLLDLSPERHADFVYHPYCRCFGLDPLGCWRKTPRPGLDTRVSWAVERAISQSLESWGIRQLTN